MSVQVLDPRFWGRVVPGMESDNPSTRVGFDSQWALPMSCCFCILCSSSLGIMNQATQDVVGEWAPFVPPPLLP